MGAHSELPARGQLYAQPRTAESDWLHGRDVTRVLSGDVTSYEMLFNRQQCTRVSSLQE